MTEKFINLVVIILGILIILSLFAFIYGMYTKISSKSLEIEKYPENISLLLDNEEHIEDFQVIDKKKILITIKKNNQLIRTELENFADEFLELIDQ